MKLVQATLGLVWLPVLLGGCKGNPSTPTPVVVGTVPLPVVTVELKGRVVDDLDKPISGVMVAVHTNYAADPNSRAHTTTDGNGNFAFPAAVTSNGSVNEVVITLNRDDYEGAEISIAPNADTTITLYPTTTIRVGTTLRTRIAADAPYTCGLDGDPCRRITIEPTGEAIVVEILDVDGQEVGLADGAMPMHFQRSLTVADGEFHVIGGPATFTLRASRSADPLVGKYSLTLSHDCAEAPEELRSRTYTATIDATATGFVVTLSDAEFYWGPVCTLTASRLGCHQFLASRQGDRVRFDLINADEWHGGYITEHVSPDRWLIVYGSAAGQLGAGAISATGSGSVAYCQGSYDAICQFGGTSCDLTDLRLTFTRR